MKQTCIALLFLECANIILCFRCNEQMSSMCSSYEHGGLGWSTERWSGEEINGGGKWEVGIQERAKLSEDSHSGYAALLPGL